MSKRKASSASSSKSEDTSSSPKKDRTLSLSEDKDRESATEEDSFSERSASSVEKHKKSEDKDRESAPEEDSVSEKSASPPEKLKKRHRRSHKRNASHSPHRDDKDSEKERDNDACHCLGVFGLSSYTEERDLKEVFSAYGDIDKLCLIYDKQSGHSKGYGFVYFKSTADATTARQETQGLVLDGRHIRVDYSLTLQPRLPNPNRYKGHYRYSQDHRSTSYRPSGEYVSRSRYRDRGSYEDTYYRRRSDRDYREYHEEYYDKPPRRHPYSHRH